MEFNQNYNGYDKEHTSVESKDLTKKNIENELKEQVTLIINTASACNQYEVLWMRPMTDELKSYLTGLGYSLTEVTRAAKSNSQWLISRK